MDALCHSGKTGTQLSLIVAPAVLVCREARRGRPKVGGRVGPGAWNGSLALKSGEQPQGGMEPGAQGTQRLCENRTSRARASNPDRQKKDELLESVQSEAMQEQTLDPLAMPYAGKIWGTNSGCTADASSLFLK